MIFTERTIKVNNDISTINNPIILYRGDYNVEVRFTILDCPYKYSENNSVNVIKTVDAYYGQLVIKVPNDRPPIFSDIVETKTGCVIFTFSGEMIDEIIEVGFTGEMRLYADINTAGSNRVISTGTIGTYAVTNYTANVANYINSLSSVIITPAQTTSYDNTMNIYEVWIDIDYSDAPSKLQNMYVGGNKINNIYLGSTNISKVYIGNTKIYGN